MNPTPKTIKPKKKAAVRHPRTPKATSTHAARHKPSPEPVAHVAPEPKPVVVEIPKASIPSDKPYFYAVGRRKTAMAKVRLLEGDGTITINSHKLTEYFPTHDLQRIVTTPLSLLGLEKQMAVSSFVAGGGTHAQAEALRHGITRALVIRNEQDKPTLKKFGLLTRDPRVKERKKPGLRKARRAPQWSKR